MIGRSEVARNKVRHNGRFCKKEDLIKIQEKSKFEGDGYYGMMSKEEIIQRNILIKEYLKNGDMNSLVKLAIQ